MVILARMFILQKCKGGFFEKDKLPEISDIRAYPKRACSRRGIY